MNSNNQIITCLLGDPVDHSVSDTMFEHFAQLMRLKNYKHLKLRVSQEDKENLKIAIRALKVFGIAGANVTLPYKELVVESLNLIDITAKQVGAVNTIVNKKGQLVGYNTDGLGAIKAIETKLRPIRRSDKILIFGAGGAARAIIAGLMDKGVDQIIILNRSIDFNRAVKLKGDFAAFNVLIDIKSLSDENILKALEICDVVINATSVGMYPNNDGSVLKKEHMDFLVKSGHNIKDKVFFDAVFNPYTTTFLMLAESYGAKICPGIYMMIYQGIEAFKLWTNQVISLEEIEKISLLLYNKIQSYEK